MSRIERNATELGFADLFIWGLRTEEGPDRRAWGAEDVEVYTYEAAEVCECSVKVIRPTVARWDCV